MSTTIARNFIKENESTFAKRLAKHLLEHESTEPANDIKILARQIMELQALDIWLLDMILNYSKVPPDELPTYIHDWYQKQIE